MNSHHAEVIKDIPLGLNRPTIKTHDVTGELIGAGIDPFLVASFFDMTGPTFPPHPHAGFTVATYLLPESESAFWNQDSTGFTNRIAPGGLHATVAGRGVLHEETNEQNGRSALGFQIWLDMKAADRLADPHPLSLEPGQVPELSENGATIRVLVGSSNGLTSPLRLPTPIRLVDVSLAASALFRQELDSAEQGFVWMVSGQLTFTSDAGQQTLSALQVAVLDRGPNDLNVVAGADGARFVVFVGTPLKAPVVMGGPFVGSTEAQIAQFWEDFHSGRMGHLTPFSRRTELPWR